MKKTKRKAFTLIELIVVIAIISVLAAIAIPRYMKSMRKAAEAAHKSNVSMLQTAAVLRQADGNLPVTWPDGSETSYVEKWPNLPKGLKFSNDESSSYKVTIDNDSIKIYPSLEDVVYSSETD